MSFPKPICKPITQGKDIRRAEDVNSPRLLLRGLDSLYVSFYLDTTKCNLDWDDLAYRKEKIGREHGDAFDEVALGTETFALRPYGKHPYKFVLANRSFEVRLSERLSPSCFVQFYSEALWTLGLDHLTQKFSVWCDSVGLRPFKPEVVSRADWAFDYHLPVTDFTPDHFVSRATKDACWRENGAMQTVQFGQGDVLTRVYDKVAEIEQQSDKAWFFQLWGRKDKVWRVEFQVRGPRLKLAGIRTIADLKLLQSDLLRELAANHTSLRRPNGDSNRSRWPLHPLWQQLTDDIASLPQTGLIRDIDTAASLEWRTYQCGKSILGYFKRLAVFIHARSDGSRIPDLEWVLEELPEVLKPHYSASLWEADVEQRIKAYRLGL